MNTSSTEPQAAPSGATEKNQAFVVIGKHQTVPGIVIQVFLSLDGANRYAAELVNTMLDDSRDIEDRTQATAETWEEVLERLWDAYGQGTCDVSVCKSSIHP